MRKADDSVDNNKRKNGHQGHVVGYAELLGKDAMILALHSYGMEHSWLTRSAPIISYPYKNDIGYVL